MNWLVIADGLARRLLRKRLDFVVLFMLPAVITLMTLLVHGMAARQSPIVGLADCDQGPYAGRLVSFLAAREGIVLKEMDHEQLVASLEDGDIKMGVVIPSGFSAHITAGEHTAVAFLGGAGFLDAEMLASQISSQILSFRLAAAVAIELAAVSGEGASELAASILDDRAGQMKVVIPPSRLGITAQAFTQAVGLSVMFIMINAFGVVSLLNADRRRQLIARTLACPVTIGQVAIGYGLGSFIPGSLQVLSVCAVSMGLLGMRHVQDLIGLWLLLTAFLVAAQGMGFLICGGSRGRINPGTMMATIITPTSLLGGILIPMEMMPRAMQVAGYAVPQRWLMLGLARLADGASLAALLPMVAALVAFGLIAGLIGARGMREVL